MPYAIHIMGRGGVSYATHSDKKKNLVSSKNREDAKIFASKKSAEGFADFLNKSYSGLSAFAEKVWWKLPKKNPGPSHQSRISRLKNLFSKQDAISRKVAGKFGTHSKEYQGAVKKLDRLLSMIRREILESRTPGTKKYSARWKKNPGPLRHLPKNVMDKVYRERVKLRGYNGPVSVMSAHGSDAGKILRKLHPEMTREEHLSYVAKYRKRAQALSALYSNLLNRAARQTWGRPWQTTDYRVSGIGSDEFSAPMKKRLREAVTLMNAYDRAFRAHHYAAGNRGSI